MPLIPPGRVTALRDTLRERRVAGVELTTVVGVAFVVLALVVALALTLAPTRKPPAYTPVAGPASGTPAPAAEDPAGTPSPLVEGTGTGDAAAPRVALVVGDGFAAGPGQRSFGCLAAREKGWRCVVVAAAGSGYHASGPSGTFADQLAAAAGTQDVGLVVVSGGGLDNRRPAAQVRAAATELVAAARETFPEATVVLVPPFRQAVDTATTRALAVALRSAADGRRVRFADPADWFAAGVVADGSRLTPEARGEAAGGLGRSLPAASADEV